MNNKVAINMAKVGKSSESKEGAGFVKYTGIAPFFITAVNPSLKEMQTLYPDRTINEEPNYKYVSKDDPTDVGVYVVLHLKANNEHKDALGIDFTTSTRFLIKGAISSNKDKTKFQCINDYGDTVWMTPEDFKAKNLPSYADSLPWDGMRPAYVGEAELIENIKCFLGIAGSRNYDGKNKTWTAKEGEDLQAAICAFDKEDIQAMLSGNMSAVKEMINQQPDNQIKYPCAVRTTEDGKEYQEIYTRYPIRFGTVDYKKFDTYLTKEKEADRLSHSNFGIYPFTFQKYEIGMTNFSSQSAGAQPPVVGGTDEDPFAGFTQPTEGKF